MVSLDSGAPAFRGAKDDAYSGLLGYNGVSPEVAEDVFIAPGAHVIGAVTIGRGSSVWFNSVLRGDDVRIVIGCSSNIQDGVVIHGDEGEVRIGDRVTIGHCAIIHGCHIEDEALVGMGAVILDGAVVESGAIVAAGALVPGGKVVKSGTLWAGCPAKMVREIDPAETRSFLKVSAHHYQVNARSYLDGQG